MKDSMSSLGEKLVEITSERRIGLGETSDLISRQLIN